MRCEKIAICPYYKQVVVKTGTGAVYQQNWCETDRSRCARYLISRTAGQDFVPEDLYPNMHQKMDEIISELFCDIESI